jgi:hypothetical protein
LHFVSELRVQRFPDGLQHHFFVVAFEADHAAIGDGLHLHQRFDDEPTFRTAIDMIAEGHDLAAVCRTAINDSVKRHLQQIEAPMQIGGGIGLARLSPPVLAGRSDVVFVPNLFANDGQPIRMLSFPLVKVGRPRMGKIFEPQHASTLEALTK